jgi:two-component system chemotaxis response regulator CheY
MVQLSNYKSKSFLLVDDEPFMREVIERILKKCEAERVFRASDGGAALELLEDKAMGVHCVISDLNMNPMNGLQLLQAIRGGQNPRIRRNQAFIMLTGTGQHQAVTAAQALDVNRYILKPVSPDKLLAAIDAVPSRKIDFKPPEHYRAVALPATL